MSHREHPATHQQVREEAGGAADFSGGRPIPARSGLQALLLHRNHRCAAFAVQGRSDPAADGFGGSPKRIVV
jgi:hypothetical protein